MGSSQAGGHRLGDLALEPRAATETPAPSPVAEGLRLQGERRQRRAARRVAEDRRTPDTETLTATAQNQGEVRGFQWTPG